MKFNNIYKKLFIEDNNYIPVDININDILKDDYYLYSDKYSKYLPIKRIKEEAYNIIIFLGEEPERDIIRYSIEDNDNIITVYKSNILNREQKNIAIQKILNSIKEDIFKPASPEEVEKRKLLSNIEEVKSFLDRNTIEYKTDNNGNIIDIDISNLKSINYLIFWIIYKQWNICKYILDLLKRKGIDFNNIYDNIGRSLVNNMIEWMNFKEDQAGSFRRLQYLIDNGYNINQKDKYGYTPLQFAHYKGYSNDSKLIKLLQQYEK